MCSRHRISLGDLTEVVLKAIQMQISLIGNMEKIIDKINQQPAVSNKSLHLEKQLNDKEKELEKMINVIDGLYMDWKCGDITRTEYARMKSKFESKAKEIQDVIVNLKLEVDIASNGVGSNDPYLKRFLKYENIKELNRGILVELIDTIYVHENNKITVKFNFEDQYQRMLEFIENNRIISEKEE